MDTNRHGYQTVAGRVPGKNKRRPRLASALVSLGVHSWLISPDGLRAEIRLRGLVSVFIRVHPWLRTSSFLPAPKSVAFFRGAGFTGAMGFFDRLTGKKSTPAAVPASPAPEPSESTPSAPGAAVKPRLAAARERLQAQDLAGAMAIYEEVLAGAGDRADVLVAVSGDLGSYGHVAQIVELVAPRYVADRHGPATGLNLLQAYLALRDPDSAQQDRKSTRLNSSHT